VENKVKFGDEEFEIYPYRYRIVNAFAPALKKLNELEKSYLGDLDTTEYDKHISRIRDLRKSVEQTLDVPDKKH
jgi:hypothetical protein